VEEDGILIERDKELLGTEVMGYCMNKARTVSEITHRIYKNGRLPNIAKIFLIVEKLVEHRVLMVKNNDNQIRFQMNGGFFEKK